MAQRVSFFTLHVRLLYRLLVVLVRFLAFQTLSEPVHSATPKRLARLASAEARRSSQSEPG